MHLCVYTGRAVGRNSSQTLAELLSADAANKAAAAAAAVSAAVTKQTSSDEPDSNTTGIGAVVHDTISCCSALRQHCQLHLE
jgi:hypothetical protein